MKRITNETNVEVKVNLYGKGESKITTGMGFFNHMLELFAKHSGIDLTVKAKGDLNVDEHHTVEDIGICLGKALNTALKDKRGIERYGFLLPMDESLAMCAIDLGGRGYLEFKYKPKREFVGDMPTELIEDFFLAVAENLKANIHIQLKYGRNEHHKIEAIFKAFARALKMAIKKDGSCQIPSTKGKIS